MNEVLFRKLTLGAMSTEARTVEASLSSEQSVPQFFGDEVLSHEPGAIDLTRAASGLPLLLFHDQTRPIGLCENVRLENRKLKATLRFFSNPDGDQALNMVREGMRSVSIGYRIDTMKQNAPEQFTATKWTLLECSIVAVPADTTVGIGRSLKLNYGDSNMEHENTENETIHFSRSQRRNANELVEDERQRVMAISALGDKFHNRELARQLIDGAHSMEAARSAFLERIVNKQSPVGEGVNDALGLNSREMQGFSIARAMAAASTGDWRKAGLERAASDALSQRHGRETAGFFVPREIFNRAPYAVGAAGTGGNVVATDLLAGDFIDILRNQSAVIKAGAKLLSGLVGNVAIPRRNATTTSYWVSENSAVTESEGTFDQVTLSPKTVGCYSKYSRLMLLQSTPDIEMLVRSDLVQQIALAIDLAAISGTGASGQPTGILNIAGTGAVVGGTNGATLSTDHLISLYSAVANSNAADGQLAYLLNSKSIGTIASQKATTGQYIWAKGDDTAGAVSNRPDVFQGRPIYQTNQLPSTLTKGTASGVCSALIFGNWNDLLIGEWGVLEILANPYGSGFSAGVVEIRAMQTVDIAVRHAASFAVMSDALTS